MSDKLSTQPIVDLPIESLVPFSINPFGLYGEQRLTDMVESIEAGGVLVPIIVRPLADDKFEILSGHNRVEASKIVGLKTVPTIVRDDLTDDEALLVSIETNLIQRSYAELSHSERAVILSTHHDAIKSQGRRTDLIKEVEELLQSGERGETSTSALVGRKLEARERTGMQYGLSKNTVARYLRISKLIKPHQDRLDRGIIALYTAVSLSYLTEEEQELVDEVLTTEKCKINMAEAEELRHEKRPLTRKAILRIVMSGDKLPDAPSKLTLSQEFLSRFFSSEQTRDEMESIIEKALEMYLG